MAHIETTSINRSTTFWHLSWYIYRGIHLYRRCWMQKCRLDVSEKRKSLRHPFLNQYFKYINREKDGKVVNPNSYYRHILHKLFICFIIDVLSCLGVIFVIASFLWRFEASFLFCIINLWRKLNLRKYAFRFSRFFYLLLYVHVHGIY